MKSIKLLLPAIGALLFTGCLGTAAKDLDASERTAAISAAIAAPERSEKDRGMDVSRRPLDIMAFAGVAAGQTVIDLFSAGGWYAELLARAVGPKGVVYAQNPVDVRMSAAIFEERLSNNRLPNVVRWDKDLNDLQLPAASIDGAMLNLVFHDFYTLSDDVDDILADLYSALKPGAWVVVVDHSAPEGSRESFATDPRGAHRIDEMFARELFAKSGFVLEASSDIFRNPSDDRQKAFFAPENRGKTTDKFVLRFRKPRR
jgi:predicted methyltransferase